MCQAFGGGVSAKKACLSAAKALRDAAARFELLALEEQPYQQTTHRRINSVKLNDA